MKVLSVPVLIVFFCLDVSAQTPVWHAMGPQPDAHPRHENAFVKAGDKLHLIGGRGLKPIDIYDPTTQTWKEGKQPPVEMHHFQAVSHEGLIYVMGALTGGYPYEVPISHIYIYDPLEDLWIVGPEIPVHRRRGAAGLAVFDGKFYLVCGIVNGHTSHWVPWLDEFDPQTQTWRELADAPRARDHFQAGIHDGKLYAAGGRRSGYGETPFQATIPEVDVYDFAQNRWTTLPQSGNLPTLRAGSTTVLWDDHILVLGGESPSQQVAHNEVEALDLKTLTWKSMPNLQRGRHGTQVISAGDKLFIAGGCGNRGGNPELTHLEVFGKSNSVSIEQSPILKGTLTLERLDVNKNGEVEVLVSNTGGNQGLVLAYVATDPPVEINLPVKLPHVLSPGDQWRISLKRPDPEAFLELLVKPYGKAAPLKFGIE